MTLSSPPSVVKQHVAPTGNQSIVLLNKTDKKTYSSHLLLYFEKVFCTWHCLTQSDCPFPWNQIPSTVLQNAVLLSTSASVPVVLCITLQVSCWVGLAAAALLSCRCYGLLLHTGRADGQLIHWLGIRILHKPTSKYPDYDFNPVFITAALMTKVP